MHDGVNQRAEAVIRGGPGDDCFHRRFIQSGRSRTGRVGEEMSYDAASQRLRIVGKHPSQGLNVAELPTVERFAAAVDRQPFSPQRLTLALTGRQRGRLGVQYAIVLAIRAGEVEGFERETVGIELRML